jgi:tetrapyrrole methylase family protein/MazG family protein
MAAAGWIAIADLGQSPEALPQRVLDRLSQADHVLVTSPRGAAAAVLDAVGIRYESYADHGMSPAAPADQLVETLRELGSAAGVVLGVAGYPFLRQGVVRGLLTRFGPIEMLPASSPLEVLLLAFDVDETADLDLVDASALKIAVPERGSHLVVTGVPNAIAARTVSRRLGEIYPAGHIAAVATARAEGGYELRLSAIETLPALDVPWPESALYVAPYLIAAPGGFDELVRIMAILRAPDGCPWDLQQTHMSLRPHLIEEAYEAVAAVESGDMAGLADELGDIMLQVVFHAQIAAEAGDFAIDDAIANIVAKLRRRHPHIFGDGTAQTPDEVMHRWDRIKRDERPEGGVLDGIAHTLPALAYADKISRRAVSAGFEWETVDDVWEKVREEIDELRATDPGSEEAVDEVGDLLFTVVNVARKMGVDAETALRDACGKFIRRFEAMEAAAAEQGRDLTGMDGEDMEALWRLAKDIERGAEPR